jgi:hypothetical protein
MRVCVVIAKASGAKDKIADATNNRDLFIFAIPLHIRDECRHHAQRLTGHDGRD